MTWHFIDQDHAYQIKVAGYRQRKKMNLNHLYGYVISGAMERLHLRSWQITTSMPGSMVSAMRLTLIVIPAIYALTIPQLLSYVIMFHNAI